MMMMVHELVLMDYRSGKGEGVGRTRIISERHTHLFDVLLHLHGDLPNARPVLEFSSVIDEFDGWTWNVYFVLTRHN